ncbi:hypothetical protein LINPERHAP2_LOCUS18234 [Linum perenne]
MYRHLDRIPFWSIANSICRLKVNNQGRREAIHNSWFSRAFATSNGSPLYISLEMFLLIAFVSSVYLILWFIKVEKLKLFRCSL